MAMPFELSCGNAGFLGVAILIFSFVRGYSGFGFSALVITTSALVTNPLHFVAVVVILETVMSLQAWNGIGKSVDWQRVWLLMAGAAVGMPLGLWALTSISADAARAVISSYVLLMCVILLLGWRFKKPVEGKANILAGVVSGLANAPGMGGLPLAAFFAAQPMSVAVFRATLVAYFPLLDLMGAPMYFLAGLVSWDTIRASFLALPLVFLGNWLGSRHFLKTDPKDFRHFSILLLAGLAVMGLIKAVA